ncbi:hypothetical protein AAFF_G00134120 [Aldrovandia affinis]|uniref:Uncharacterized protein n=1 Tax=Aldrovandia affinis TaxID=143900 RepID=A0AAD7RSV2_9TELE|nr:hypothetical protein AAFF_G00134120 [Aldrovandia affinis]
MVGNRSIQQQRWKQEVACSGRIGLTQTRPDMEWLAGLAQRQFKCLLHPTTPTELVLRQPAVAHLDPGGPRAGAAWHSAQLPGPPGSPDTFNTTGGPEVLKRMQTEGLSQIQPARGIGYGIDPRLPSSSGLRAAVSVCPRALREVIGGKASAPDNTLT